MMNQQAFSPSRVRAGVFHRPAEAAPPYARPRLVRARRARVLHLITGLGTGGAEMMLYKLLSRMDGAEFESEVVSLTDVGLVGERIRQLGVPVTPLGMRRGVPNPQYLPRLVHLLRASRPDLLQTWMYHANLAGGLAAKLAGGVPVVWNIQHGDVDARAMKALTLWTIRSCAPLSARLARRIVCCGELSRRVHAAMGYDERRMTVIPNGSDLSTFRPDDEARPSVRRELDVPPDAPLVGLIARFHPKKDHYNFIRAAAELHRARPDAYFVLCGDGVDADNRELAAWVAEAGISHRCRLLGTREDMPRLTAALDIATSASSYGEGFPNVLGEAMACEVPCVATDVGDSARMVGPVGRVVSPRTPTALAGAWRELLALSYGERRRIGRALRRRAAEFGLPTVVSRYEKLYTDVLAERRLPAC
jgi:glycosyltransferase involved in cell wall biosynthesis